MKLSAELPVMKALPGEWEASEEATNWASTACSFVVAWRGSKKAVWSGGGPAGLTLNSIPLGTRTAVLMVVG